MGKKNRYIDRQIHKRIERKPIDKVIDSLS